MKNRSALLLIIVGLMFLLFVECKKVDLYKVLGVDPKASQREIQKAFHKLSLKYHPDKNKDKGAQAKFAEINNAYDILSDEQKRKNYDLYGDEKGTPGFDAGGPGDQSGYTYFTSGGPGSGWQNMGGQQGSKSFSFSFGGPRSGKQGNSFAFGLDDIFSNFFGGGMGGEGSQFGGFSSSGRSHHANRAKQSTKSITNVNSQVYRKEIVDSGMTWLLLAYNSDLSSIQYYESVIEEVSASLQGALKVGRINCDSEADLCEALGTSPSRGPKIIIHSYPSKEKGYLVEFSGDVNVKSLKSFCQDNLPRISKRINLDNLDAAASEGGKLPKVLLLSTKKNTPVIWRALSGLYRKRFVILDAQVNDVSDPSVRKLGVDSLPAIVGWLSNGEKQIIKSGISVKDLKSAIQELSRLLDNFEKKNKKAASAKNDHTESGERSIQLLTSSNFNDICGEKVPVCLIGVCRSSTTKDKLQKIFQSVSQKSFSRGQNSRDSVAYALLDASKQQSFLNAFDKSGFKSSERLLAYKPKRGTYATSQGEITEESVEGFISAILNGDVQFAKARQKPTLK